MDFAKKGQLTDVVLFGYWQVGAKSENLPAVQAPQLLPVSSQCNFSTFVKAREPSEEKKKKKF